MRHKSHIASNRINFATVRQSSVLFPSSFHVYLMVLYLSMLSIPNSLSLLTPLPLLLSYFPLVTCLPATLPGLFRTTRPSCATIKHFPAWYQPSARFDDGDCEKAIQLFKTDYADDHKDRRYEFLASGVDPTRGIPTQRVPLRVTIGSKQPLYPISAENSKSRDMGIDKSLL